MSTSTIISAIVAVALIIVVGFQTRYMMEIKSQLDEIRSNQSSELIQKVELDETPVTTPEKSEIITLDKQKDPIEIDANTNVPDDQKITGTTETNNLDGQEGSPVSEPDETIADNRMMHNPPSLLDDNFYNNSFDANTWNPLAEIERMQRDMDRMFDQSFYNYNRRPDFRHHFRQNISSPKVDVREGKKGFTVIVDLQGLDEADISVTLDGRRLKIEGQQDFINQKQDSYGNSVYRERRSGSFKRSITLPAAVRQDGMRTRAEDGILIITIPKAY